MKCKNPHCKNTTFQAVIEMDNSRVIGLKCMSCGARYSLEEIEILKSLKRTGWNSVKWRSN
jgi:hypothetical protein